MTTNTTDPTTPAPITTTPTRSAIATTGRSAVRRRPVTMSEHEQMFHATARMRRHVVWTFGRWTLDADAAAAVEVWEAIATGSTDEVELFRAARRAVRRARRHEERAARRRVVLDPLSDDDPFDRAADRVAAEQTVRQIRAAVPASDAARQWIAHRSALVAAPMTDRMKQAGRRWAVRARAHLEAGDDAA